MLKKIFKTILVLSICVGISLPTNAAVSVSDGSAFVTKAEFAADLNNLSNRMAQLENSLDAKIDSLVSSYLTRNGIWNGAKQQLSNSFFDFPEPKKEKLDWTAHNLSNVWNKVEVFTASKTGLVFFDYDYYSTNTNLYTQYWGYKVYMMNGKTKNFFDDYLILTGYFLDESDNFLTTYSFGSTKPTIMTASANNSAMSLYDRFLLAIPIPANKQRLKAFWFVNKGSKYYFQLRSFVSLGFASAAVPDTNIGAARIDFVDANVY